MATITNRSNFVVSVPRRPEHERSFAFDAKNAIATYVAALHKQGLKPKIVQLEDSLLVRIRRVGHPDQTQTFTSAAQADAFVKRIESEQTQGLFIDYTAATNFTFADAIRKYIIEDCPGLRGGNNYTIMLEAILDDSENGLRKRIEQRKAEMREFGKFITPLNANREPMGALEWVQLPLTQITTAQIEDFVADRVQNVEASTVARQLDLMVSIMNRATSRYGYHLEKSPFDNVRRPKYFNERDRRLVGDEEERLLDAARHEDQHRSLELRVQELVKPGLTAAAVLPTHYARNAASKSAYEAARRQAVYEGFAHVPFFETFIQFQIATAARRGETLGLTWKRLNTELQTAHIPRSKNGRPRDLVVRKDILELLMKLPRDSELVFDIGIKELNNSWNRIRESAGLLDLHIHDFRHEGISRAVESGLFPTVLELQSFSGHRDLRSLSRYCHPKPQVIAARLEQAEESRLEGLGNGGRQRLKSTEMLRFGPVDSAPGNLTPVQACETNQKIEIQAKPIPHAGNVVSLFQRAPRPAASH